MKNSSIIIACLITLLAPLWSSQSNAAAPAEAEREEKRFKGVELYSWKDDAGDWRFSMLAGTNRLKSSEEVKAAEVRYDNVDALKAAISKLARGEYLSWTDRLGHFPLPPKEVRKEILKAAEAAGVRLMIDLC